MKEIKNILRGSDGHIYLILSDGTTERTDAARLEPIAAGKIHYKHDFEEAETEDGETVYKCPDCGENIDDPDDLETLSIYDYFDDNDIYNIEYRIDGNGELSSVEIMIACGGPNIYIDTEKNAICLYWWGSSAQYPIAPDTADAVEEWARECCEAIR